MSLFDSELPNADLAALNTGTTFGTNSGSSLTASTPDNSSLALVSSPSEAIAFVDTRLSAIDTLIAGLEDTQVVLIESGQDGISQVTAALDKYNNLDTVHIFSHGADGQLQLGDSLLSRQNVEHYGESLQQWADALSAEADLMIYGCNLANGPDGLSLISKLGELTGADIAASDDLTGASGDWILEATSGDIESTVALSAAAQASYQGVLSLLKNGDFEQGLTGWKSSKGAATITTDARSGAAAVEISGTSKGIKQTLAAVAGETYTLTGAAKTSSSGSTRTGITFYAANGERLTGKAKKIQTNDWSEFSLKKKAPTGTQSVRVWAYKADQSGSFILDNLSLSTGSGAPSEPPPEPPAEVGSIGLATSTLNVSEGDGSVTVTVNRTGGSQGEATVDYRTVTGSATAGEDYEATTGTLTFADGQTQQSVDISLLDDNSPEEQEVFGFAIDNVTGSATLGAPRTAQIAIADNDGFTYNGNQYVLISSAKTWLQAQAEAERLGGNLVTINTAQEETWLKQTFGKDEGFWIGINDIDTEGTFEWASGESVGYTNWAPGEPNNGRSGQDYGWMNFSATRQWDDDSPEVTRLGIIEIGDYNGPQNSQGNGLKGEYYNNTNFTDLAVTRTDRTINFDWGKGSPAANVDSDTFSVRWRGKVEPRYSENYTFQTNSDDGVRLWVNDRLIINKFLDQDETKHTGSITLEAGQQYDIRLDYYEQSGDAISELSWSSTSQALEIIPKSQLYSDPVDNRKLSSQSVISGLRAPTSIDWLTDGSERMLVAEKGGVVKLYENGSLRGTPFIDISDQVNRASDRGLLDIAVHPDFANNPYVYLLFTYDPPEVFDNVGTEAGPDGTNNRAARLVRVTADKSNNYRTAVAGSEVVLLGKNSTWDNFNGFVNSTFNFDEPEAGVLPDGSYLRDFLNADSESHSIGSVEFGPDGALYVSNGDGASYNQVDPRATRVQDVDSLSGKVLRINPITGKGLSDNPFFNGDAGANRSKVYQSGLRNPFRMTVDPEDGKVYIGDVGWTIWEEINAGAPGANFGWPYYEGGDGNNARTGGYKNLPSASRFYDSGRTISPSLYGLNHLADGIIAIVMGDVYTGDAYPERYNCDLFFGDLGQGIIRNISFDSKGKVDTVETFD
ncbi:MAG: DUF4347 domain-containing protein, partial [Phormidesmis sp.]